LIGSHNNHQAINQLKFLGFLFTVCLLLAAAPSYAQERSGFAVDDNAKGQDELNPHMDSPINSSTSASSSTVIKEKENYRDSVSVKPAMATKNKPDSSAQKKTEEETLSFNFLYFIIQKFKVSDMMN
jgi:hypothetical protein